MPKPIIYFIRHGETDWNAVGRLQGRNNIPINARGRTQASACGSILRDLMGHAGRGPKSFNYISSPLIRARATMEIVRPELGLPTGGYLLDDRLQEIAYGEWEGLTLPEARTRYPRIFALRERDKWKTVPPAGESYAVLAQRVASWYGDVAADSVVTAHGGTLRALMVITGFAKPAEAADLRIEQGAVYAFIEGKMVRHG